MSLVAWMKVAANRIYLHCDAWCPSCCCMPSLLSVYCFYCNKNFIVSYSFRLSITRFYVRLVPDTWAFKLKLRLGSFEPRMSGLTILCHCNTLLLQAVVHTMTARVSQGFTSFTASLQDYMNYQILQYQSHIKYIGNWVKIVHAHCENLKECHSSQLHLVPYTCTLQRKIYSYRVMFSDMESTSPNLPWCIFSQNATLSPIQALLHCTLSTGPNNYVGWLLLHGR